MSAAPEPVEPLVHAASPEISEAAELARERLHEEIERVRSGVEQMLDEQDNGANGHAGFAVPAPAASPAFGPSSEDLRRELDQMRLQTREYVKRKVRKSEKKLEASVRALEARSDELEQRIDQVEADREEAEWRIHTNTEEMLDGLLDDVRSIADRLAEPAAPPAPAPAPAPKLVGRIGRPAAGSA